MDIFEYAMQMEKDGEIYYRELSARTGNKGIKNILTMLADAEVIHYKIFQAMKGKEQIPAIDSKGLADIKNIFARLKEEVPTEVDSTQVALYRKAQDIEKKTRDFYLERAEASQDMLEKTTFQKVANEENMHYLIMGNIIDFVNAPATWLENPEWYHMEEY
ncbi:MAG TPA: ferritin family protein [Dissulfurispiraceae bacterium]|nr:ferritin family protein [Dissulfurispiraceae bacterium]